MHKPGNYRQSHDALESIIERLQSSDLDVDQTIKEYQKGITIVDDLEKYLKSARNKINKIGQKPTKTKK